MDQLKPTKLIRPKKLIRPLQTKAGTTTHWTNNLAVRLICVWSILVLGIIGLGWRLYYLQIKAAASLEERAKDQQMVSIRPYIPRRPIVDRKGNIIATDQLIYSLFVHPKMFSESREFMAEKLAAILQDRTKEELLELFATKDTGIRVSYKLTEEQADLIAKITNANNVKPDGIELIQRYGRFYPQDEVSADVIGYVDQDHKGQAGIEFSQQKLLERDVKTLKLSRAGNGSLMPTFLPEGLMNFDAYQLQLTIDIRLQRVVRTALAQRLKMFNAKRGTVVVMDVRDGSLLSLVTEPSYDPNRYWEYANDLNVFKNWAVSDLYEPGSTFKPINIAIALDEGIINPDSVVYDGGQMQFGSHTIYNHNLRGNGNIDVATVLQRSSNIGMIKIMSRLDASDYYDWLLKLGFGESLNLDLPGETVSYLKPREQFLSAKIEAATATFGQGLSLNPIKLAQLHAAIANGGTLVTPHVVRGLKDDQNFFHWQPTLETKQVFTPENSHEVVKLMETVVSNGSGKVAAIDGYGIGGKTGTAQKASPNGGYYDNKKITSFVSILPVESPRYVVLVVVDEPQGQNTFGSTVAAPLAKEVMEAIIGIEGIPPNN